MSLTLTQKLTRKAINISELPWLDLIIPKSKNYQKFIILCRSRTGSNYLVSLLQSHPQIRAFGEVFTNYDKIHWGYPGYDSHQILELRQDKPIDFLNKIVYRSFLTNVSAVGFKLFYNQANYGKQKAIWDYLRYDKNLKVIHLKRKNVFQAHVSHKLAEKTKEWISINIRANPWKTESIWLDYADCLQIFEQTKYWETEYAKLFANYPDRIHELYYEDLANNTEEVTQKIQDFLGVEHRSLAAYTKKQSSVPIEQQVVNYLELKTKFQGTEWQSYFQ